MALTPNQQLAQYLAEIFYNRIASSEDHAISRFDSVVYRSVETALIEAIKIAYDISDDYAREARDYLAEYGADDTLLDTKGFGINSYVQRVHMNHAPTVQFCGKGNQDISGDPSAELDATEVRVWDGSDLIAYATQTVSGKWVTDGMNGRVPAEFGSWRDALSEHLTFTEYAS